jgi:hypothetical protein
MIRLLQGSMKPVLVLQQVFPMQLANVPNSKPCSMLGDRKEIALSRNVTICVSR